MESGTEWCSHMRNNRLSELEPEMFDLKAVRFKVLQQQGAMP